MLSNCASHGSRSLRDASPIVCAIHSGLGGGLGPGAGYGGRGAPARAYDEYFKAYSMAMLNNGRERANVSYGGKSASTSAIGVIANNL